MSLPFALCDIRARRVVLPSWYQKRLLHPVLKGMFLGEEPVGGFRGIWSGCSKGLV
ncbi:MAG: hypothetical protein Q7R91_01660 [bacterium]|nr:hypothetical protein [bacterium]